MSRDLASYLAANPAMTVRDWKGKGFTEFAPFDKYFVLSGELPWDKLDRAEVRRLATSEKARFLPRSYRMAAARDPGLIWDERSRSYRLRPEDAPAPSPVIEGRGAKMFRALSDLRPAAAPKMRTSARFCTEM